MKRIKLKIKHLYKRLLSVLLYHANTKGDKEFYQYKTNILEKFGTHDGFDLQIIPEKECFSCNGTGWYCYDIPCYNCDKGVYLPQKYIVLKRYDICGKSFHVPQSFFYHLPTHVEFKDTINGLVKHEKSEHADSCKVILYLIMTKGGYIKHYYSQVMGWKYQWYYPKNWAFTIFHFMKYGKNAYPIWKLKRHFSKYTLENFNASHRFGIEYHTEDDLPF